MTKINAVLQDWWECKQKIKNSEKRIAKYKKFVKKYMHEKGTKQISGDEYAVSCRNVTTQRMVKKNIPLDIWNQYSSSSTHEMCTIKKV